MIRLSIVIPIFNKISFTKSCLADLSHLPDDHEIIVIDNGSTDETQKELSNTEKYSRIVYIRNDTNVGFGRACCQGYAKSTGENVLFLNNDIRVKGDLATWTEKLIERCDDNSLVGPTMGQLDNNLNFVQEKNEYLSGLSYMSGWCLAARRSVFDKLDISGTGEIFDNNFFCYFEDSDLSFRAREQGIKFLVVPIPVVHFGKTSSKQLNVAALYQTARKVFIKKWSRLIKKK